MYVVSEQRPGSPDLVLYLPRGPLTLRRESAASGRRYTNGTVVFSAQEGEARLELGDRGTTSCRENRRRSVVEAAKLSGAELWATGNEPGWTLRLFEDRIVLVTAYGERTVEVPTPEPTRSAGGVATWRSAAGGHALTVTVYDEECRDTMSGELFGHRVEVELDGTRYLGCGLRFG